MVRAARVPQQHHVTWLDTIRDSSGESYRTRSSHLACPFSRIRLAPDRVPRQSSGRVGVKCWRRDSFHIVLANCVMPKKKHPGSIGATVPKLMPHLVPKPLWGKSAAQLFKGKGHGVWKRIRSDALQVAPNACQVCSEPGPDSTLNCHELWDYDDEHSTATLVGLRIQCRNCDCAVHMGRAEKHGFLDVAIAQLCKVNGITEPEAIRLYRRAKGVWSQRNKKQWRIVVAKRLMEQYPELAALEQTGGGAQAQD